MKTLLQKKQHKNINETQTPAAPQITETYQT